MSLQYEVETDPALEENERLRMEVGWPEVGQGLMKVVLGYVVFAIGMTFGIGLIVLSIMGTGEGARKAARQPGMSQLWMFYIVMGVTTIIGLFSYGLIIAGKF